MKIPRNVHVFNTKFHPVPASPKPRARTIAERMTSPRCTLDEMAVAKRNYRNPLPKIRN